MTVQALATPTCQESGQVQFVSDHIYTPGTGMKPVKLFWIGDYD